LGELENQVYPSFPRSMIDLIPETHSSAIILHFPS
jgi:hypothetical protein